MSSYNLTTLIAAPVDRVWRALCDPHEVVAWDSSVVTALDAPADYPRSGEHVRWRCRPGLGPFTLLHDRPQTVEAERRLASILDFGPCHIDETYELTPEGPDTRLDLHLDISLRPAILAPILQRLFPPAAMADGFQTSLDSLKRHCETGS